jgi:CHAT domain-containing protein
VPDTADLVCDVAKALGAGEADIHLGPRAIESTVKAMSAGGLLADYAVINLATHGAVAGELTASDEPGLVLTPPDKGSEEDDGYLSASEVTGLKLDADWVILSACNTAAGGAGNAEALSGLARAFFYAGARSLLVSHWPVRESAAVALVTHAVSAAAADRTVGRAEAMRRAMLALADSPDPSMAHPSYWAPFVVVGEGAAAR